MRHNELIRLLETADPKIARAVASLFEDRAYAPDEDTCALMADEIFWALGIEYHFGMAVARGYAEMTNRVAPAGMETYRQKVHTAAANGPTLGGIVAAHLTPVMLAGDDVLFDLFFEALAVMLQRGSLSLTDPFQALSVMLRAGDRETPAPYLRLLISLFSNELDFNQTKFYAKTVPRAVLGFPPEKRPWRTRALLAVTETEYALVNALLAGFGRGLERLSATGLRAFVALGLKRHAINPVLGRKFLSLDSRLGLENCAALQRSATLEQVRDSVRRYVKARTGRGVDIRSFADAPGGLIEDDSRPAVYSDGRTIYLPPEIECGSSPSRNRNLYKCLIRLETGFHEYGTYDFDLERLKDLHPEAIPVSPPARDPENAGDFAIFFSTFPNPRLAEDLFAVVETGRIWSRFRRDSPGLVAMVTPFIREAAGDFPPVLACLYARLTFGCDEVFPRPEHERRACHEWSRISGGIEGRAAIEGSGPSAFSWACPGPCASGKPASCSREAALPPPWQKCAALAHAAIRAEHRNHRVEDAAALTAFLYPDIAACCPEGPCAPMRFPFQCRPRPAWTAHAFQDVERLARSLQSALSGKNISVYRSDLRRLLTEHNGMVSPGALQRYIRPGLPDAGGFSGQRQADSPDEQALADILESRGVLETAVIANKNDPGVRYPEWDCRLNDYLNDHVRVVESVFTEREDDFYRDVLERRSGLVRHIRRAFEMLRPEGSIRLRRWRDGDELDYREMLNFAVDRKSGRMPSDRLYIKRLKQERDVAVLLLVDLSRSTAHPVGISGKAVLDVEKEAIVLFREALEAAGDRYAVAGFSGSGRLAVDYYRVKDFDEERTESVRRRISAMAPRRNTRMGAAIRHATRRIAAVDARLRLLMILGDGFPNDTDYKQAYAVADTRMAVNEARARDIHVHAITVNMASNGVLDALYGRVHHNIIADVRELPDKLMRIYGRMTV